MSNLEDIITRVADFIKRYKCINPVSIHFTLGKYTEQFGFEKHLFQIENYTKIINLLENCNTWEYKNETEGKQVPRKILDTMIIRCKNGPYDIIVTAQTNTELLTGEMKSKENIYKRKNHTFSIQCNSNSLNEIFYTANVIADIPDGYKDTYIAHSSLLKVIDLILACEYKENLDFSVL